MENSTTQTGRLCDAGRHLMDPNWDSCPYCEAEKRSGERSEYLSTAKRETRARYPASEDGRETVQMPTDLSPDRGRSDAQVDKRRIVGVLITYTWRPEGELFPIRLGRNFIGAGDVGSIATYGQCDIRISGDEDLSAEHALILCRHGTCKISDQKSTNGTFLNGEEASFEGMELPNYAEIKTGSTLWTFVRLEPPLSSHTGSKEEPPARTTVKPEGSREAKPAESTGLGGTRGQIDG